MSRERAHFPQGKQGKMSTTFCGGAWSMHTNSLVGSNLGGTNDDSRVVVSLHKGNKWRGLAQQGVVAMTMQPVAMAMAIAMATVMTVVVIAAPEAARIVSLPGFSGSFPSPHYSGYITIDQEHDRQLFYYFVTSENDPRTDPVVLWMNGGPGCSSFDGFIYEHGPFNFVANKTSGGLPILEINPYSWTKIANIIYLESPAGVGFSYSNITTDYTTGDNKTASDVHTFLLKWFEEYAEFQSNSFYVSGESYAGVYVPTTVQEIVNGIQNGLTPTIRLKGYMIGNGVTDEEFDGNALVPFVHGMGLISEKLYEEASLLCNGSYWNVTDPSCDDKLETVKQDISRLNIYDILEPCYHSTSLQSSVVDLYALPDSFRSLGETSRSRPTRRRMFGRAWPMFSPVRAGHVPSWSELGNFKVNVPCLDLNIASQWLNDPSVRDAIHALPEKLIGKWVACSDLLSYTHDAGSMLPYHHNFLHLGYKALIFSGDHDMCVPFTGSEAWTRSMGFKILDDWRPWFVNVQVAGYTISYANNLTFATVKGAGHTVPEYKPKEAFALFKRWLAGDAL